MRRAESKDCTSDQDAGVSRLFPPQFPDPAAAKEEILHVVRREPRAFGIEGTRWTLAAIHQVCDWLRVSTPPGLSQILDRLGISWKRARSHIHSPDPDYLAKLAYIEELAGQCQASQGRLGLLYMDEFGFYRQPTLAQAYEERGPRQPLAERAYQSDTVTRVVGSLDPRDGRVVFRMASKIGIPQLVAFYQQVWEAYPQADRLYLVQDNWPVHVHPDVLEALEKQEARWPYHRPSNWPTMPSQAAQQKYKDLQLPIQLIALPTYASWTNPIEKLWRWTKADLLHLHRWASNLLQLRAEVSQFLTRFANGSQDLLRYVGLLVPD